MYSEKFKNEFVTLYPYIPLKIFEPSKLEEMGDILYTPPEDYKRLFERKELNLDTQNQILFYIAKEKLYNEWREIYKEYRGKDPSFSFNNAMMSLL